jgi:hypothetical protein
MPSMLLKYYTVSGIFMIIIHSDITLHTKSRLHCDIEKLHLAC